MKRRAGGIEAQTTARDVAAAEPAATGDGRVHAYAFEPTAQLRSDRREPEEQARTPQSGPDPALGGR
jgi:hypothetical protein